jgi:hypothetical protein
MFFDEPTRWGIHITWNVGKKVWLFIHNGPKSNSMKKFWYPLSQSFGERAYTVFTYYVTSVGLGYIYTYANLNGLLFWLSIVWGQGAAFLPPWTVKNILYQASPTNPKPVSNIGFITMKKYELCCHHYNV